MIRRNVTKFIVLSDETLRVQIVILSFSFKPVHVGQQPLMVGGFDQNKLLEE